MTLTTSDMEAIVTSFIQAYATVDLAKLESLFLPNAIFHMTTPDGSSQPIGVQAFIQNVIDLDVKTVQPQLTIKQTVQTAAQQVLTMVEVQAQKNKKSLHNFAGFLINFEDGKIASIFMVDALPAYSADFWTTD